MVDISKESVTGAKPCQCYNHFAAWSLWDARRVEPSFAQ